MWCFGFCHLPRSVPGCCHSCRVSLVPSGFWQGLIHPGRTGTWQDLPVDAVGPSCWMLGLCFAQQSDLKQGIKKPILINSVQVQSHCMCCWSVLQQGTSLSGTLGITALKFTAVQNKCVNSMEFVYLILLYNTLNLIPSKRNNLAKTSLNSLIRTGWLILFEQMDYFAIRSTNVNQLYF